MRIETLWALAKLLSATALLLALTACGMNTTSSQQTNICGGCAFLYATTNSDQILTLAINSDGTLASAKSTAGPANGPDILGAGFIPQPPYGSPLYISDPTTNAIDAFVVNASDGSFTMMTGSPFALGGPAGAPAGLLISGNYLYAGDTNGTVSAFAIGSGGVLTTLAGSPFPAGTAPLHLISAFTGSPSIPLLYSADSSGGGIWAFTIGADGLLTAFRGLRSPRPSTAHQRGCLPAGTRSAAAFSTSR